jgi:predicted AlkP superfamily phosphohydrolase/phosphomutase
MVVEVDGEEDIVGLAEKEFEYVAGLTLRILKNRSFDFATFYAHYPDTFNHWLDVEDYTAIRDRDFSRAKTKRFLEAYTKLDEFLGELMVTLPDANIVILSDHGVSTGYRFNKPVLQHIYGPNGIFIAMGPDIRSGNEIETISMLDILPTILYYYELPIAEDLDGEVVEEMFRERYETISIASYNSFVGNERIAASPGIEDSVKERLKALGYIQ